MQKAKIEEKLNSMDGQLINYLWEKISDGPYEQHEPELYYVLEEIKIVEKEDECEKAFKTILTTKIMHEYFTWSASSIRKTLKSLNLTGTEPPKILKKEGRNYRPIFFSPKRLEKRLREFVPDYEPKKVLKLCGKEEQQTF